MVADDSTSDGTSLIQRLISIDQPNRAVWSLTTAFKPTYKRSNAHGFSSGFSIQDVVTGFRDGSRLLVLNIDFDSVWMILTLARLLFWSSSCQSLYVRVLISQNYSSHARHGAHLCFPFSSNSDAMLPTETGSWYIPELVEMVSPDHCFRFFGSPNMHKQ